LHTFEWRIAWGMYAREWAALGASVDWSWAPGVTSVEQAAVRESGLPPRRQKHAGETAAWSTSFTQDMSGREGTYALQDIGSRKPRIIVAKFPPRAPWKEWVEGLKTSGYLVDAKETLATDHGDPLAVNRVVIHAERKGTWKGNLNVAVLGALTRQDRPCGIVGAMRRASQGDNDSWLRKDEWELVVNPRINRTGEIMLPWPRGKVRIGRPGSRRWSTTRRAPR